jgi:hypothetical protein
MYFPYQKGRYEVAPGLLPLSKDFGNGSMDQKLFQMGEDFKKFRTQFEENRAKEPVSKYVCLSERVDARALGIIAEAIAQKLHEEYPDEVQYEIISGGGIFSSKLTDEKFEIKIEDNSVKIIDGKIKYENAWDAMGAQIPEDIAIWKLNDDGSEELEALHLNAPNHWSPSDKVGKSFSAVHTPVAHIEKIVPWAVSILQGVIQKGPFVRFAWGVGTDHRLNHHPEPAPGMSVSEWSGRSFDPKNPKLYARVERQALWGYPTLNRALFTIRTYFQDMDKLKITHPDAVKGLIEAIESMSPQSLVYKGLVADKENILHWLRN